jgi:hypothetical protein
MAKNSQFLRKLISVHKKSHLCIIWHTTFARQTYVCIEIKARRGHSWGLSSLFSVVVVDKKKFGHHHKVAAALSVTQLVRHVVVVLHHPVVVPSTLNTLSRA